jgi:hypothetical protein
VLVLFDHGTPKGLALVLSEHTVYTAQSKGWDRLDNGRAAERGRRGGLRFGAHNRPADPLPAESETPARLSDRLLKSEAVQPTTRAAAIRFLFGGRSFGSRK